MAKVKGKMYGTNGSLDVKAISHFNAVTSRMSSVYCTVSASADSGSHFVTHDPSDPSLSELTHDRRDPSPVAYEL